MGSHRGAGVTWKVHLRSLLWWGAVSRAGASIAWEPSWLLGQRQHHCLGCRYHQASAVERLQLRWEPGTPGAWLEHSAQGKAVQPRLVAVPLLGSAIAVWQPLHCEGWAGPGRNLCYKVNWCSVCRREQGWTSLCFFRDYWLISTYYYGIYLQHLPRHHWILSTGSDDE